MSPPSRPRQKNCSWFFLRIFSFEPGRVLKKRAAWSSSVVLARWPVEKQEIQVSGTQ